MTRRRQALGDLDRDIRDHIEQEIQDNLNRGMAPEEASRAALRAFGNITRVKEETRAVWIPVWLDQVYQDVRYGLRVLLRDPGFTAVAITMLALGIGVNATVFAVTNAVLFKGFPLVRENHRLVYMTSRGYGCCVSYPDYLDWRAQAKSFEGIAVVGGTGVILSDQSGFAESYAATQVTSNTFQLVGQRPILGRDFMPSDEVPGAAPVAILSYGFWDHRFGKDPAVIGRSVRINGAPTTLIGVMPEGFSFPQLQDLWIPLMRTRDLEKREARGLWVAVGRLAGGATARSARAEMDTIGRRLASAYPLTNRDQLPLLQNFQEFFIGRDATMIYSAMLGAVGFVLLIACANLANLMLARSIGRSREISVRIALGAGRWRIIRQLVVESVMLSGAGGVLGWWIAKAGVHAYQIAEWPPGTRPWRVIDYSMDYRVLAYLVAISIGTGILFGLAPALRLSKFDVSHSLKEGGRGAAGGGRAKQVSRLLVIAEMALAVVLLTGAGVMVRSFLNIYTASVGVNISNLLTASMALPDAKYTHPESRIAFFDRLKTRLDAIPGIESITLANRLPAGGALSIPYEIAGQEIAGSELRPTLFTLIVGPDYFRTMGAAVLSGREFNDFDSPSGIPAVIVNRRFADRFWPGEDPLGKHLRLFDGRTPEEWLTVVGVVSNIVQDYSRQHVDPLIYVPYRQKPAGGMNIIARTRVPPASLGEAFRREVQALDPDLPIFGPGPLADRMVWSYWNSGFYGILFLIFAAIALLLASIGLYAVIAHSVTRRTSEIGIRMAIGATPRHILALVLGQGMLPLGIGLAIGLTASFALTRILKAILVQVSPADPITYIASSAVLILAAMLGCWIPARRAMRVDPATAVRHE
jgi:putative ABC transport system permease protein